MKYLNSHKLFIKTFLVLFVFILAIPTIVDAAVIRLNLYYDNGTARWDKMAPESIQYFQFGTGDYRGTIVSFRGAILDDFKLDLVPVICSDGVTKDGKMTGGCVPVSKGVMAINIPYYGNGHLFKIFDKAGKMIFVVDLTSFAFCNENKICEINFKENSNNCSSDCSFSPGTVVTPTASPNSNGEINWFLWAPIIIGALILGTVIYFVIKKYHQNLEQ